MKNMKIVCLALPILAMASGGQTFAADTPRPNILFIYTDDQSYKTVSCYPEAPDWVHTPSIDRLADRGVRFERCYLGAWCMPSRASVLTGRFQHAIESMTLAGSYPSSTYDPAQCPFLPAELRRHGYQTAQIGKWHTGVDAGYGRDWDFQMVWNRPAHPDNAGHYYTDQIIEVNGKERRVGGYATDNYTDWAVDYIRGSHRDPNKPWYLWLCYTAIHGPTTPAGRHLAALDGHKAPVPKDIYGPWPEKPLYLEYTKSWVMGIDDQPMMLKRYPLGPEDYDAGIAGLGYDQWIQQVNECAMALDEGIGRVLEALEKSGQLTNTLVVFTSDQGYGLGEHGFNQKHAPYDATIAAPLIISQPGTLPEGKVCRYPVNSPDLVDLFSHVTGVPLPWKTDGRDIRPLLENPERTDWNRPMLLTHTGKAYGSETDVIPSDPKHLFASEVPWWVMLRDGRYKYIRTLIKGETEEIYDLDADPEELVNLAVTFRYHDLLLRLRALAIEELHRSDAKFADSMPPTAEMLGKLTPSGRWLKKGCSRCLKNK